MELVNLKDLYIHELQDLYSAERQIMKALPKMARAAKNASLAASFRRHLKETERHASRLEIIIGKLGVSLHGDKCEGMEGLLKEGDKIMAEDAAAEVRDAGLIAAAQRVEHYEIAGYGTARTYARVLGYRDAVKALELTLKEEGATDKKLTALAEKTVNPKAKKPPARKASPKPAGFTAKVKKMAKKLHLT